MPPPNIHAMAAAPSAKAKSVALQAACEATVARLARLASEAGAEAAYAEATVALEARLSAEADAYNKARAEGARS